MKARSSLSALFAEYGSDLRRFIGHKFGDVHDAEDIVQDAFHNMLRKNDVHTLENPRAYIYQAAHNLALNRIRKQNRHDEYISVQEESITSLPLETHISAQRDLESVQKALVKLPENCRQAFVLSRVHGKTYAEIANELNVSISTVEKYLIKALRFLKEHLDRA